MKSAYHGSTGFALQGATVINSELEKRDPALKNITEALHAKGLEYTVDGCALYWFQIEDPKGLEYYLTLNEVEVGFYSDWFEKEKSRIRGHAGNRYYDACEAIASSLTFRNQSRDIRYTLPQRAA